ncbi:MAG TPA: hypothetical protein VFX16_37940 [Pseudonocardiaceae bacterium]|nr:hypothetical protein [Pseudonocardiaceae bacterium]
MQRRSAGTAVRAFSVLGVGVTVVALAVTIPAPVLAATPAADPSVLTKSAQDVTNPGANPVGHGDTVKWVLNYNDNDSSGPGAATITDPIDAAGTGQTYVPGSLQVPPGWSTSFSTDGTTFGATDPGTATAAVRATNPTARQGGTNLGNLLLAPVQPTPTATGGDGFTPIIHRTPSGEVEAWNIYHHLVAPNPKVVCSDLTTGQPCAGGPWPRPLNTAVGSLGSGPTGDIASTLTPQYVQDPNRPGVVYYPALTAASVGVGCLNMDTQANCGYVPLESPGGTESGFVRQGGDLYGVGTDGRTLCMTMASQTPCAGEPFAAVVPGNRLGANANFMGSMVVTQGKVFISSNQNGSGLIGCFDPATSAACAGWSAPLLVGAPNVGGTFNIYTDFDTAGGPIGVCSTTSGATTTSCYAIDGTPLPDPGVFRAVGNGNDTWNAETATAPGGDLKSYFGVWGTIPGATVCYDWTTASPCPGFPALATHPSVNSGATRDYGYSFDTTTQCLFGLGDAGFLFSEDPTTGASPCVHSGASVSLTPSGFYCDGRTDHTQSYTDASLEGINLADVNLAASTADVTDPDGTVIANPAFAPNGTLDLSGISAAAHPSINVTVHLVLANSNDFTGGNQPRVVVSFVGDPPQVCFETSVAAACTVNSVTDTANGTDTTGAFTSNTVALGVAPGANCQPNVTVNKEICASNDNQDCGPGGAGPWVKQAPEGLLGVLLAHPRWRITVTNNGPVDVTGVRINDHVEPSCVTAGGTFDLASGASKQVFCSTSVLLSLLPLTNTASATFVPANSPQGTSPITTASSSAVACSLLCVLRN